MKTRLVVVTAAVVLASSLACQRAKDNKPPIGIRDAVLHEPAGGMDMGAQDSGQKVVVTPKQDAATHEAAVLGSKILPVKKRELPINHLKWKARAQILNSKSPILRFRSGAHVNVFGAGSGFLYYLLAIPLSRILQ